MKVIWSDTAQWAATSCEGLEQWYFQCLRKLQYMPQFLACCKINWLASWPLHRLLFFLVSQKQEQQLLIWLLNNRWWKPQYKIINIIYLFPVLGIIVRAITRHTVQVQWLHIIAHLALWIIENEITTQTVSMSPVCLPINTTHFTGHCCRWTHRQGHQTVNHCSSVAADHWSYHTYC